MIIFAMICLMLIFLRLMPADTPLTLRRLSAMRHAIIYFTLDDDLFFISLFTL